MKTLPRLLLPALLMASLSGCIVVTPHGHRHYRAEAPVQGRVVLGVHGTVPLYRHERRHDRYDRYERDDDHGPERRY